MQMSITTSSDCERQEMFEDLQQTSIFLNSQQQGQWQKPLTHFNNSETDSLDVAIAPGHILSSG